MSAQAAGRVANAASKAAGKSASEHVLNKGAKRDPELYVCIYSFHSFRTLYALVYGSLACIMTSDYGS